MTTKQEKRIAILLWGAVLLFIGVLLTLPNLTK